MEYIVQVLLSAPQQPSYVRSTYVCMGSVLHSRSHCLLLSHTVNHRCYHNKTRFRCLLLGSWLLAAVPRNEQTAAKEYFPLVTSEKSWITTVVQKLPCLSATSSSKWRQITASSQSPHVFFFSLIFDKDVILTPQSTENMKWSLAFWTFRHLPHF